VVRIKDEKVITKIGGRAIFSFFFVRGRQGQSRGEQPAKPGRARATSHSAGRWGGEVEGKRPQTLEGQLC